MFMNDLESSGTKFSDAADARFMDHALALAARGIALASPNPMVGAVLVREGKIVGEGFHTYEAVKHAEIVALEAARNRSLIIPGGIPGRISRGIPGEIPGSLVGRAFRHDIKPAVSSGVLTPEGTPEVASDAARGATLYVTLEPCCHTGRTGPCTQAVIAAGVSRVVAAMADPNPAVAGISYLAIIAGEP